MGRFPLFHEVRHIVVREFLRSSGFQTKAHFPFSRHHWQSTRLPLMKTSRTLQYACTDSNKNRLRALAAVVRPFHRLPAWDCNLPRPRGWTKVKLKELSDWGDGNGANL